MTDPFGIAAEAVRDHLAYHHPLELGTLLAVMQAARIETVLEIGTCWGGSAWAFCQLPGVRVSCIEIAPHPETWLAIGDLMPSACLTEGNSRDPAVRRAALGLLPGGPPDMVFIDGDHTLAGARADFAMYRDDAARLVVLHDTQNHFDDPDIQVRAVWEDARNWRPSAEIVARPGIYGTGILWV